MSVVAAAVIGTAVVGGVAANSAANKSASAAKAGIASSNALAEQARTDSINLFARGLQSSQAGISGALKFYQDNAQSKINPFIQGNTAAQKVIGQGATQANNAILGLPVDMSFANKPQSLATDYSGITSAQLPVLGSQPQSGPDVPPGVQMPNQDPTGLKTLLASPAAKASATSGSSSPLGGAIQKIVGAGAIQNLVSRFG